MKKLKNLGIGLGLITALSVPAAPVAAQRAEVYKSKYDESACYVSDGKTRCYYKVDEVWSSVEGEDMPVRENFRNFFGTVSLEILPSSAQKKKGYVETDRAFNDALLNYYIREFGITDADMLNEKSTIYTEKFKKKLAKREPLRFYTADNTELGRSMKETFEYLKQEVVKPENLVRK